MKIAVLSGKGGTGKTLVSTNLAAMAGSAAYLDCDVEEPNGHLFFKPQSVISTDVTVKIPVVDEDLCKGCRVCVDFCKFNALASIVNKLIVFDEICHSCGGCIILCPQKALTEKDKVIGKIKAGVSEQVKVFSGILNTGEASGTPIIKALLEQVKDSDETVLIDCPPGSACIVMESIRDADFCVLVAEPTLFGLHNMQMVYELVKLFNKPHGIIINKCLEDDNPIEKFARLSRIPILGQIPFNRSLGKMASNGEIVARVDSRYQKMFQEFLGKIKEAIDHETVAGA
ncbi:ATP-binding protein [Eubacteriaceae bacterium ES3]|nr:ATP-binding protein [Eubacteriaceae bacterium ES3]